MVDVLVAWNGSAEAHAALRAVKSLVGDRVGRLTFARVVAFDAPPEIIASAESELAEACDAGSFGRSPSTVLLGGQPAVALKEYAQRVGYDVLGLGTRGGGLPVVMAPAGAAGAAGAGVSRQSASPFFGGFRHRFAARCFVRSSSKEVDHMAQPRSGKKQGKTVLEKRRLKQEKKATQAVARRKRDRLATA